jgi:hypothetical protein
VNVSRNYISHVTEPTFIYYVAAYNESDDKRDAVPRKVITANLWNTKRANEEREDWRAQALRATERHV